MKLILRFLVMLNVLLAALHWIASVLHAGEILPDPHQHLKWILYHGGLALLMQFLIARWR